MQSLESNALEPTKSELAAFRKSSWTCRPHCPVFALIGSQISVFVVPPARIVTGADPATAEVEP